MQSRLWRNTFKAAVIALLFSPSIIGAEGGMAPGPALVVLILNIVNGQFFGHGKDGFFWFLLLICAPMLVVWSIAFAINYAKDKNRQIISEKETGVL